jgi:S1-C subfamily serine protease
MKTLAIILLGGFGFMVAALLSIGLAAFEFEAEPAGADAAAVQSRQSGSETVLGSYRADIDIPVPGVEETEGLAATEEQALVRLYEQVSPSVVNIGVYTVRGSGGGSGFVIDSDGHIVTNNHVVENAEMILVQFADETVAEAELVGADADSDLAVIRVDVPDDLLKAVPLADSSALRVGQLAIAVGSPFGFEQTMTTGIISALGRIVRQENGYSLLQLIQTDAAINPGNSGGPLLNAEGEVIGVNTLIFSSSGSSAGIGFAVPVDTVKRVVPSLIATGGYADPWLGIRGLSLNPMIAEVLDLPVDQGVLLQRVAPQGPADRADLRGNDRRVEFEGMSLPTGGDIVVAINGAETRDMDDLDVLLAEYAVGQIVTLDIFRGEEMLRVDVLLEERPVR